MLSNEEPNDWNNDDFPDYDDHDNDDFPDYDDYDNDNYFA